MPAPNVPSYQDGLTALGQLVATCINTALDYIVFDGDPTEEGVQKRFMNQAGTPLGSDTRVGFKSGTVNMQLTKATDALPRPSFVFLFDSEYYIGGNVGKKVVSNGEVKFSVAMLKAVNPVVTSLLSSSGQFKTLALTKDSVMASFPNTVVNIVGTIVWSATGLPAGVVINSATGALTGTPTVAGTSTATIIATDGTTAASGFGLLEITVAP